MIIRALHLIVVALIVLAGCGQNGNKTNNTPESITWNDLAKNNTEPEWFIDSKLGIYFTWGPYTVAAYQTEWYPRWMYLQEGAGWTPDAYRFPGSEGWARGVYEYHDKTFGPQTEFNYHDLIPLFKAEHFDAANWADLFLQAGAKFAGPVAIHHDGYALWDSDINMWNSMNKGPNKDLMGELFTEFKKRDLKTIATFHHARTLQRYAEDTAMWGGWDSHFPYHPDYATSSTDSELRYLYGNLSEDEFHDYWLEQIREVVNGYAPDIIWFDGWLDLIPEDYRKQMVAMQYEAGAKRGQEPVIVYKQKDLPHEVAVLDMEQSGKKEMSEDYWMTDITLSFASWSYVQGQTYKPVEMLLRNMIDVWSKKGIVLLNVCPRSDGVIEEVQRNILKQMGKWLSVYGEAVYNTRAHSVFGYGMAEIEDGFEGVGQSATQSYTANDVRFTQSKDGTNLYIFLLGMPPANQSIPIKYINTAHSRKIEQITELGSGAIVPWGFTSEGLQITTPSEDNMNSIATVFKVTFQ